MRRACLTFTYLIIGIMVGKCVCYSLPHLPWKRSTFVLKTLAGTAFQNNHRSADSYPLPVKLVHILTDMWKEIAYPNPQWDATELYFETYGVLRNQTASLLQYYLHCRDFASENAIVMSINQFSKRNSDEEGLLIQYIDFPIFSKDGDDFDNDVDFYGHEIIENIDDKEICNDQFLVKENIFPEYNTDETVIRKTQEWIDECKNVRIMYKHDKSFSKYLTIFRFTCVVVVLELNLRPHISKNRMNSNEDYIVANARNIDQAFYCFWKEVKRFVTLKAKDDSIVVIFPENNLFGNYALFEEFYDR